MTRDIVIVGAGPAGVSGALWARSLGLSVTVLEADAEPGGQLHHVHFEMKNFPGSLPGTGRALAERMRDQLADVEVRYRATAAGLEPKTPAVQLVGGDSIAARAVLIASGARKRTLDVPGARELEGRGVSDSATRDRQALAGEEVLVVGGGDAAFENALLLAEVGCRVTIAVRDAGNARPEFRERVSREPRIEVLDHTAVTAVLGEGRVEGARLEGERGSFELAVAGVVVKIGVEPSSAWCANAIDRDPDSFVLVDERLGTSQARVWAAGDVTRPAVPGVAVSLGHGALAAHAIFETLQGP
jgi:thioredoxin reductase (NADPH)